MKKRYLPKIGERYWCWIGYTKEKWVFYCSVWENTKLDNEIRNLFGVYKTKKEAIKIKKEIIKLLNKKIGLK